MVSFGPVVGQSRWGRPSERSIGSYIHAKLKLFSSRLIFPRARRQTGRWGEIPDTEERCRLHPEARGGTVTVGSTAV